MKHYLMEPKYKKSVAEYDVFQKEIDGVTYRVVKEEVYRWGSWIVNVPSTDEEIKEIDAQMKQEIAEGRLIDPMQMPAMEHEQMAMSLQPPEPDPAEQGIDDADYKKGNI